MQTNQTGAYKLALKQLRFITSMQMSADDSVSGWDTVRYAALGFLIHALVLEQREEND